MSNHQKKKENSSEEISPHAHQTVVEDSSSDIWDLNACCGEPQTSPEFSLAAAMQDIDIDDCIHHSEKVLQFFLSLKEMGCKNPSTDESILGRSRIVEEDGISAKIIKTYTGFKFPPRPFKPQISEDNKPIKDSTGKLDMEDNESSRDWAEEYVDLTGLAGGSISLSHGNTTTEDNTVSNEISPGGNISRRQQRNRDKKYRRFQSKSPDNARLDNGGQNEPKGELQDDKAKKLPAYETPTAPSQKYPFRRGRRYPANKILRFQNKNVNRSPGNDGPISSDNLASTSAESLKSDDVVKTENSSQEEKNTQLSRESHHLAPVPLQGQIPRFQTLQHSGKGGRHALDRFKNPSFRFPFANRQRALVPSHAEFQKQQFIPPPTEKRLRAPDVYQARFQGHQSFRFPAGNRQLQGIRPPYPAYQDTSMPPQQPPYNTSTPRHPFPPFYQSYPAPRLPSINQFQSCVQFYDNANGSGPVFNDGIPPPNPSTIITPSDNSLVLMRQESILLAGPEYYYYPLQ